MVQDARWARVAVQVLAVTLGLAASSRSPSRLSEMVPPTRAGAVPSRATVVRSPSVLLVTVIRQLTASPALEMSSHAFVTSTAGLNRSTDSEAKSLMTLGKPLEL